MVTPPKPLTGGGGRMEIAYIVAMALVAIIAIYVNRNTKK